MMETPVQIQAALAQFGETLTFTGFTLQGFPGIMVQTLFHGEHTPYLTEVQEFSFQVATSDCVLNSVVKTMLFTMTDGVYTFTFSIDRPPIEDLTGWSSLYCNYISKA